MFPHEVIKNKNGANYMILWKYPFIMQRVCKMLCTLKCCLVRDVSQKTHVKGKYRGTVVL